MKNNSRKKGKNPKGMKRAGKTQIFSHLKNNHPLELHYKPSIL